MILGRSGVSLRHWRPPIARRLAETMRSSRTSHSSTAGWRESSPPPMSRRSCSTGGQRQGMWVGLL